MTVRAWFTISALCLVALGVAVAVRFFSPIQPPELMVNAGDVRLDGVQMRYCWPQRNGEPRCGDRGEEALETDAELPRSGSMRIVAIYPVQPKDGTVHIVSAATGEPVVEEPWTDRLRYLLEPGGYVLYVHATYQPGAFVRYMFPFEVG